MIMTIANILQLIGGFVLSLGYFPQIRTSLKTKQVADIDASYYPFVFTGIVMFEFYAITLYMQTGSGIMYLITNTTTLILVSIMLVLSTLYRDKKVKK